jgi:hypothetical protein
MSNEHCSALGVSKGDRVAAQILPFVSRLEQLKRRAARNFGRFMTKRGPYTHPDAAERARLEREREEDKRKDREWAGRHGPMPGGARVVVFIRQGFVGPAAKRSLREDVSGC